MTESQPTEKNQNLLKDCIAQLNYWDFDNSPPFLTINFLSGLLEDVRTHHPSFIEIPSARLPNEIKNELEKPYGRITIVVGKRQEWAPIKEDRGLPAINIEGQGSKSSVDNWGFYFILDFDHIRTRDASTSGANSINAIRFINKYENDNKTLINVVAKLTRAALTQITTPSSSEPKKT